MRWRFWSASVCGWWSAALAVRVHHCPDVVAAPLGHTDQHAPITCPAHLVGVNGGRPPAAVTAARLKPELLQPLDEGAPWTSWTMRRSLAGAASSNLGLLLRGLPSVGTPRALQGAGSLDDLPD